MSRRIDEIIIHCTATRADWWKSRNANQKVAEVRRWHVEDRGWSDIGYHFLIDRDGAVSEGRPLERAGAHAKGHNKRSIGIALFGGHGGSENDLFSDHFTPEQERALRGLIERLGSRFGDLKVSGHNQYAAKACPCFSVPEWRAGKPVRTSPVQSTTLQASATQIAAATGTGATALAALDGTAQAIALTLAGTIALAALWIMRERLRKWAGGDR